MARLFDDVNSQELTRSGAALSNEPITMICWFMSDDVASSTPQNMISLGNNAAGGVWQLNAGVSVAGDPIRAQKQNDAGTTTGTATTTTGITQNKWHHGTAVFTSDTSRTSYLDGGSSATDTTSVADPTPDFTSVGSTKRSTSTNFFSGLLGEAAIYSVTLSAEEFGAFARGAPVNRVRPGSLTAYYPCWGLATGAPDLSGGGLHLTASASVPGTGNHCPTGPYQWRRAGAY